MDWDVRVTTWFAFAERTEVRLADRTAIWDGCKNRVSSMSARQECGK